MSRAPECLQRRYQVMDTLVNDLDSVLSQSNNEAADPEDDDDYGFKLMCKFWNILKEDPKCDLLNQQKITPYTKDTSIFRSQNILCYQTGNDDPDNKKKVCTKESCPKNKTSSTGGSCCKREKEQSPENEINKGPVIKSPPSQSNKQTPLEPKSCSKKQNPPEKDEVVEEPKLPKTTQPCYPLTQALENMKAAASKEKSSCAKTAELLSVQEKLESEIAQLEEREENEAKLLKEADAMWKKMEEEYKQKLLESKKRQEELHKEMVVVETSADKWRKNHKDLEEQLTNVNKAIKEIKDRHKKKVNDFKTIKAETADLEKKLESNTNDIRNVSEVLEAKRRSFDARMKKLMEQALKLQVAKKNEEDLKNKKIQNGNECVREARKELANLCTVLLKKKLENENLRAEAKALAEELDLLNKASDTCGEKCRNKEQSLISEIENFESQIEDVKLRCTKCNVSSDTINLRKHCNDCPRCQEEMQPCIYSGDKCTELEMNDCVCVTTKTKLMNNVFENMHTVLERQINTGPGKAVAAQVLQCLKNSTNGKLDLKTRKQLQDFILATVKTNLNLTIIGGAVKTRCEMDPDSYKELMKCLTKIKTVKAEKIDKGTDSRKAPCVRWGGTQECNCPKGPKDCICAKKAPKPPSDQEPCGQLDEDKQDIGELSICPHKEKTPCGPLCGNPPPKSDVAKKVEKSWNPKPCGGEKCTFSKNMRAAQCTLGNDSINKAELVSKIYKTNAPIILVPSEIDQGQQCDCGYAVCDCYGNSKHGQKPGRKHPSLVQSETKVNDMLNHNITSLPVTVMGQNGVVANINAELKKTSFGHVSLDVSRLHNIGEIASEMVECPVSLVEINSALMLMIGECNKQPNAVLKRYSKGEMNVTLKDFNAGYTNNVTIEHREKLFSVKLKSKEERKSGDVFIKATPSGNYKFVLEKEFEKSQKEIINVYLSDINECPANVSFTQSGTCVIDFDEGCNCHQTYHNVLLKQTDSGNVKMINNATDLDVLNKYSSSNDKCRSRFESLYEKLSTFTKSQQKESPKQKEIGKQLECGINLDKDIKIKFQDQTYVMGEMTVKLDKISLCEYCVIFKNKADELFISNVLTSWLGRLPIQKSTEQELIVFLNCVEEVNNVYGWLKMSNGKIIVMVEKISKILQSDSAGCVAMLQEKRTTTTCPPVTYKSCDTTKCFCGRL